MEILNSETALERDYFMTGKSSALPLFDSFLTFPFPPGSHRRFVIRHRRQHSGKAAVNGEGTGKKKLPLFRRTGVQIIKSPPVFD